MAPQQPTLVQTVVTNFASVASINQNITVVTANNVLLLTVINRGVTAGFASTAVTGAGATWMRMATSVNGTAGPGAIDIWAGIGTAVGAQTVAITINGTQSAGCNLDEWSNLSAGQLINNYALSAGGTGNNTAPTATLAPDAQNEICYVATSAANTETANPAAPWSNLVGPTLAAAQVAGLAYVLSNLNTGATTATWTQATGQWTTAAIVLMPQQAPGDVVWNDPAAAVNNAVYIPQASPDYLDLLNDEMSAGGTGVLNGCQVQPQTGANLQFFVGAGTAVINWSPVPIASASAQAVNAANATNPRKDLVWADSVGVVHYTVGQAAPNPCMPNPDRFPFVMLAEIDVPANATVLDNGSLTTRAHITDKRVYLTPPPSATDWYDAGQVGGVPVFENVGRTWASGNIAALASGTLQLSAIFLPAGFTVGHISYTSATTALAGGTNRWHALFDSSRRMLCATATQGATAWAANTEMQLAIASSLHSASAVTFVTPYSGLYYVGIMVQATTPPTLLGPPAATNTVQWGRVPILNGSSSTGQTTVPAYPFTAAAITVSANMPYAYVSR